MLQEALARFNALAAPRLCLWSFPSARDYCWVAFAQTAREAFAWEAMEGRGAYSDGFTAYVQDSVRSFKGFLLKGSPRFLGSKPLERVF